MIFNYCYSVSVLFADPGVFHQTPARVSPLGTEFGTRKAWLNWARLEAPKACFLELVVQLARHTSEAYVPQIYSWAFCWDGWDFHLQLDGWTSGKIRGLMTRVLTLYDFGTLPGSLRLVELSDNGAYCTPNSTPWLIIIVPPQWHYIFVGGYSPFSDTPNVVRSFVRNKLDT